MNDTKENDEGQSLSKRFASVLVSRKNRDPPSGAYFEAFRFRCIDPVAVANIIVDLEIGLRPLCTKIRVHANLSGAHFIFPKEGLAIRVYSSKNMPPACCEDGMGDFLQSFRWTAVFFVLSPDQHAFFDEDSNSFLRMATRMAHPNETTDHRVMVLANTGQVVQSISHLIDTISTSKSRTVYSDHERLLVPHTNKEAAVVCAAQLRQGLSSLLEFQNGEMHLLWSSLGYHSIQALASCDVEELNNKPMDQQSKDALIDFFQLGNSRSGTFDGEVQSRSEQTLGGMTGNAAYDARSSWQGYQSNERRL